MKHICTLAIATLAVATPNPALGDPPAPPSSPAPAPADPVPVTLAPQSSPPPAPPASAPADLPAAADAPVATGVPTTELPRESMIENAVGGAKPISSSAYGGYGEITYNAPSNANSVVDFRRFVLFFGHDFTDRIRFYSEVEVEHAVTSSDDKGEAEIEQGFLDGLFTKRVNLRGGLILMPMGIINVYHEPPSFNGVDRPDVDLYVIPTTWREPGFGVFGELAEGLRYQLYVVDGFNANGFTAASAIAQGHQEAQLAYAGDGGAIGRLDYEPVLGTVIGASAYGGTSGNTLRSTVGNVPIGLFDIDARTRRGPFTARLELALLLVGDAGKLSQALLDGTAAQMAAGPIASQSRGGYAEVGYDLMHLLAPRVEQSVTAFARFDYANTQAAVPTGFMPLSQYDRRSIVTGLVYRPIPQIALKADYRHAWLGNGTQFDEAAAAINWLF